MPNPSEMERVRQERELEFCTSSLREGYHSKSTKEYLVSRIRELEALLGIESKPYNSDEF